MRWFYLISLSVFMLSACSESTTPQSNASQTEPVAAVNDGASSTAAPNTLSESQRLAEFFQTSYDENIKDSPMLQSYLGIKWDYGLWDDVSEQQEEKEAKIMAKRLQQAMQFDQTQLSAQEQLSLNLFQVNLNRRLANDQFRYHRYIMHQYRAWHTTVPSFLINIHRVSDESDAKAYISRLEKVQPLFQQVVDQLRIREQKGIYPPKWSYDQMIQAANNVIKGAPFDDSDTASTLWADFSEKLAKLNLADAATNQLKAAAKNALLTQVKPGYESLINELKHQRTLSPEGDGVWRLPRGDAWYANRLTWFTTTDLNAEQVHQLGLDNVTRIHEDMKAIMAKVGFEGSLQDFFQFMREDPQFYYGDSEQGRQRYLDEAKALIDTMEAKIPEYFGLTPKARMIVKRVEAFREQSAGKAFYQRPALDGSRPGTYYANLFDMNSMPTYQMEALAYHEGIPGHHMQGSIAQELEGVPEFQKYLSFTAYSEGWGLYSEALAKDMGFYQDPYSDFGRLAMELWRACRLVVDTGVHAKRWSREQAIDYLVENTPNPKADATKAIERYIAMPGQATAYMVGKLKIMELREFAQKELGSRFDIRRFHDEILKDGPVPLNILQEKIERFVAENKA